MSSIKLAADTFFDTLAEIIESRIQSGNYDLDPQWFEHVRWTPCGWDLDPCKPYLFEMQTKSFCMELFSHKNKDKFTQWLIVKASTIGADAGFGLYANRCLRLATLSLFYFHLNCLVSFIRRLSH